MNLELKNNIKHFRKLNNMNQEQLANLLHVTKASICCYEHGTRTPSLEMVVKLSEIFNVTLDELVKCKFEK